MGLAVIGAQEQNDQVQRFVALERHGKCLDAASARLQRVIPDRGASAHTFLNRIILRPQQNLKPSGASGYSRNGVLLWDWSRMCWSRRSREYLS